MKKIVLLATVLVLSCMTANAQLGGLLDKAAKKATTRVTKKLTNKADEAIEKEIDKQIDSRFDSNQEITYEEVKTFKELMQQMPELPTVDQYIKHKEAELNGQTLRMMSSKVSAFNMKLLSLTTQAYTGVGERTLDSAQINEMAYRYAEMTTGLSKEELEKLSTMSEEEQNAYLATHYRQGTAEAAILKSSEELATLMEPIQPLIDEWTAIGQRIDESYSEADNQCKTIYKKYADRLKKAEGNERNRLIIDYYGEILPFQHEAVTRAMNMRMKEQLPIAEKIEEKMVSIRAKQQDMLTALLCYPQLTASQYFAEPSRLMEIPEY